MWFSRRSDCSDMGHLLAEGVVDRQRTELDLRDHVMQPDAGTGCQFGDDGGCRGYQPTRSARQTAIVGPFDNHLALASGQSVLRDQVLLMEDAEASAVQRLAHQHALARMG